MDMDMSENGATVIYVPVEEERVGDWSWVRRTSCDVWPTSLTAWNA